MINPELVHYRSETGNLIPVRVNERLLSSYTENVVFFSFKGKGRDFPVTYRFKLAFC